MVVMRRKKGKERSFLADAILKTMMLSIILAPLGFFVYKLALAGKITWEQIFWFQLLFG